MELRRVFSAEPLHVNWIKTTSNIKDSNGNTVFELPEVEVPDFWSENAVNIVASKYFKKINGEHETSVKQLINRVGNQITCWGFDQNYFDEQNALIFKDELTHLLTHQMACFNSPIWFNFGVPNREQQAAACFLLGLEDTSESIRNWTYVESKIFKGGSGSGINLSNLRHKNAPLSTGGYASGPMSFAMGADRNAGIWKSGGATRRAATLRRMDVTHPDIEEFITCKSKEEKKAKVLVEAGYSDGIDGDAYNTVAFQNMNHSVGVTNDFMRKVVDGDEDCNRIITLMAQCAWESGDPGIQYHDIINQWNTIPNSGPITTSNPCGEYLSTDWSSCLLASFNLIKFVTYGAFDYTKFKAAVDIITLALDIIIDKADYPDERFKDTAHRQRQLGLGYSNLGALLMSQGLAYDSDEGRDLAARIASTMTAEAYLQSAHIAKELGAFEDFEMNADDMRNVINAHYGYAVVKWGANDDCAELWLQALQAGSQKGWRNATESLIAPTGTISFMMDCDTTGLEPEFSLIKHKKLVGGGTLTIVNNRVEEALKSLGYSDDDITAIWHYVQKNGTVVGCPEIFDSHVPVFACAVGTKNVISHQGHLDMVAAIQPFVSMGISKTINMPNSATVEDICKVYIDGWKKGIKSISIYRDGSKHSQPLNAGHSKAKAETKEPVVETTRKPLPAERPSLTHKIEIAGFEGYITVGLYEDGRPGEVFIHASKLGSTVSGLLDSLAISISFALQHGVPLHLLSDKFKNTRFEPAGFTKNPLIPLTTSIVDYIFRWLEQKFILEEKHDIIRTIGYVEVIKPTNQSHQNEGVLCKKCGELMQRTGTCFTCHECGDNSGGCM